MVTVADLLELEIFKEAKIISGVGGLENEIKNTSIIEMPINTELSRNLVVGNEFYISTLFAYKNKSDNINLLFEQLIEEKCSGICILDTYADLITEEVVKLANQNNFPIIVISRRIPYFQILEQIFRKLIASKDTYYMLMELKAISISNNNKGEIGIRAKKINPYFMHCNCAAYVTTSVKTNMTYFIQNDIDFKCKEFLVSEYEGGYLVIMTFNRRKVTEISRVVNRLREVVSSRAAEYQIGVSQVYDELDSLKSSINEAVEANVACAVLNKGMVNYNDIGILKLLFQLKDNGILKEFKDNIIYPIKNYEKKKSAELYETAEKFIECDGSYIETAKKMFIHVNTVRYRIDTVKSILKMENSTVSFIESLSIAVKAEKLLSVLDERNKMYV